MIFLLSPDQQFPGSGVGTISLISYSTVFRTVKRFFVAQWAHPRVQAITKNIDDYVFMGVDETAHDLSTNADDAAGKEDFTDSLDLVMASLDDEDSDDNAAVQASVSSSARAVYGTPPPPPTAPTPEPTRAPVLQESLPTPMAPVLPIVTSQRVVTPTLIAMPTARSPTPGPVMIADSQSMPAVVQNQNCGHPRLSGSAAPTPVSIPRSPPAITIPAAAAGVTHVEGEGGGLVETGTRKKGKKKSRVASLNADVAPIRRSSRNANA
jgi:hypothetical protein